MEKRFQKRTLHRNNSQIRTIDRGEETDVIGHARVIRKDQNRSACWNVFAAVYPQVIYEMRLQKSAGCFAESYSPNIIVKVCHLLGKFSGRLHKELAHAGSEKWILFQPKGGDQIIEIDLCKSVELRSHKLWIRELAPVTSAASRLSPKFIQAPS